MPHPLRICLASALVIAVIMLPAGVAAAAPSPSAAPSGTAAARAGNAASAVPCAIGERTPIAVPTPSPLPTHDASLPTIGGERLSGNGLVVTANAPPVPTLAATSWLVADLDSGAVLGACGPHRYGAPASLEKLLLADTMLGRLNPSDVATITPEDVNIEPGSSSVGLVVGGHYSIETLWLGLFLNSGNDAAQALARLGSAGKTWPSAIPDMNGEARRLGAWDTHAETPSGLDGPGQVTSAYDLALIFRAGFAREDFRRYISTRTAQMPPQPPRDPTGYQIQNDNRLLFEYPGALGGKTGFTDIARHTYAGAAQRNGRRLLVTVLGAEIMPNRAWQQAAALLDWGFNLPPDTTVGHLVAPGDAEKLLAPPTPAPPSPAAAPVPQAASDSAGTGPGMLAMGVGAVAFAGVALAALVVARRRRTTHRRWRADRAAVDMAAVDMAAADAVVADAAADAVVADAAADAVVADAAADAAVAHAAVADAVAQVTPISPAPEAPVDVTAQIPLPPPLMGQPALGQPLMGQPPAQPSES